MTLPADGLSVSFVIFGEKCILMCLASSLGRNVFICILQEANGHALQI